MSNDTAGREGPRHCSSACNHVLRWAFIEAVHGVQCTNPHFSPQGATAGLSSSVFRSFSMHCWTSQQWHPVVHFTRVVRNAG